MYSCTLHRMYFVPKEATTRSLMEVLHPILCEVDIQAVEESPKQSTHSTHQHEDDQVIGIP